MAYYVHNQLRDSWQYFNDWWSLIRSLQNSLSYIAHNVNDTVGPFHTFGYVDYYYEQRFLIIYDEFDRIVHKDDIEESLKRYNPRHNSKRKNNKVFYYRKGPVPGIHKRRLRSAKGNFGKRYISELRAHKHLFPNSGRMNYHDYFWWDNDYHYRENRTRVSWKNKKVDKQWMKA